MNYSKLVNSLAQSELINYIFSGAAESKHFTQSIQGFNNRWGKYLFSQRKSILDIDSYNNLKHLYELVQVMEKDIELNFIYFSSIFKRMDKEEKKQVNLFVFFSEVSYLGHFDLPRLDLDEGLRTAINSDNQ